MTDITAKELGEYTFTGELDIAGSVKPDKESKDSKRFTLRFKFNHEPLSGVFAKALKQAKVDWANGGSGRDNFDKLKDNQIIVVDWKSPGAKIRTKEDRIQDLVAGGISESLARWMIENPEEANKLQEQILSQ
jgi:hypothetical protein